MLTRKLGNSDMNITTVGFGSWAAGGSGWDFAWGAQDDADSIAAIHRALDLGVNWIDTAAVYGIGHSEEIVATSLKEWRGRKPYIFTKCALHWDAQGHVSKNHKRDSILKECEDSLKRLKVDTIDLYQVHWPPEDNGPEVEGSWQTMANLQKQGKVRWIGVSNYTVDQMKRIAKIAPVTSNQPPYSMLRRKIESDVLPHCQENGIGILAYSPMHSGMLTGSMTRERAENLPTNDWRKGKPEFREPRLSKNLALVDRLRVIAKRHGRSPGEVAVAWVVRNPAVTGAIVGARNAKQAEGVMCSGEYQLTPEDVAEIESAVAAAQS
jgi:aryl-alcohol dehydrogenase-like predicted oxidoreductase